MHVGVPTETLPGETRVALTPEVVQTLTASGHVVSIQCGAGQSASHTDSSYEAAGAQLVDRTQAFSAEIVLKVRAPTVLETPLMARGTFVVGMLDPFDRPGLERMAAAGLVGFALESVPRTSRAQRMDVLSSQATVAGYKAVILAAHHYQRFLPMLMTAAGTVKACRVVVLGVGVAGLQAIATAKRLGAVIEASDVRPAVKEQVESLGARFIDVPYETAEEKAAAAGVGGYAGAMPHTWLLRQAREVAKRVANADIVITTALIPGKPAPVLLTEEMVRAMKPGSVVVDLASINGGNCVLTEPGRTVVRHGVLVVGETNLPTLMAADASALYARNVLGFLMLLLNRDGRLEIPIDDDIVFACLMTHDGVVLRGAEPI